MKASAPSQSGQTTTTGRLWLSRLPRRAPVPFRLEPEADARRALAAELGVLGLPKLRLAGRLIPRGHDDWDLEARLDATVQQSCVVTLEPVRTRIAEPVERFYRADWVELDDPECEIPADDRLEPLPQMLDLSALMAEALALALPPYPRKAGVGPVGDAAADVAEETEDASTRRPLATLKALLEQRRTSDGG